VRDGGDEEKSIASTTCEEIIFYQAINNMLTTMPTRDANAI
jgi:hypothetical protein